MKVLQLQNLHAFMQLLTPFMFLTHQYHMLIHWNIDHRVLWMKNAVHLSKHSFVILLCLVSAALGMHEHSRHAIECEFPAVLNKQTKNQIYVSIYVAILWHLNT